VVFDLLLILLGRVVLPWAKIEAVARTGDRAPRRRKAVTA